MLTAEQKQLRRSLIGGTIATAIIGTNPWMSAHDAFLELTGQLEDAKGNDATDAGNRLERVVIDWLQEQTGADISSRDLFVREDFETPFSANVDAVCWFNTGSVGEPFLVEAKTTGIVGPRDYGFGDVTEGEGVEVPERVIVQTAHYLRVLDAAFPDRPRIDLVLVPVLIGGEGFRLYRLRRNEALVEGLRARLAEWWEEHVLPGTPPAGGAPSVEVLKRVRRQPGKTVPLDEEVYEKWRVLEAARKQAEKEADAARAEVIADLGDAEAGVLGDGRLVTYYEQSTKRINPTLLRRLHPEAAAACEETSTCRVLRAPKARKERT